METRKTVLFIVEGPTDATALEKIFKSIYRRSKDIRFSFTNGDISSDSTVTKTNVTERIYAKVTELMNDTKIRKKDIFQIVQIFDMDGAYVSDEAFVFSNTSKIVYSCENISCNDPRKVSERNYHKREIMDYLLSVGDIKGIPYETYFMSCNLDHALYNRINLEKELKQEYADAFYEKFLLCADKFIDFLNTDVVNGVPRFFKASWEYIKQDKHSLERHTNLHIYFDEHPKPDGLV